MAGDWIKWVKGLNRKREVLMIAARLKVDARIVSSSLMDFWEWCDENIGDVDMDEVGNAFVTVGALQPVTVDALSNLPGLCESMQAVDWFRLENDRWAFPNFGRHNGQTAKTRALTASRVGRHRDKDDQNRNAPSVTDVTIDALAEKRREDINTPHKPPKGGNGAHQRDVEIYEAYPRHVGKNVALRAIAKARKRLHAGGNPHPGEYLLEKTTAYAAVRKEVEGAPYGHTPHPATWFNQGRYDDDPEQWRVVYNEQRPVVSAPVTRAPKPPVEPSLTTKVIAWSQANPDEAKKLIAQHVPVEWGEEYRDRVFKAPTACGPYMMAVQEILEGKK